jgi:hypothetical protein
MDNRLEIFWEQVKAFNAKKMAKDNATPQDQIFPTIKPNTAGWSSWEAYFHGLGIEPAAMKRTRIGTQDWMTVPTLYPEWFDASYKP